MVFIIFYISFRFKDLTEGKYKENDLEIPFTLFISKYRRRQLLNAMMSKDKSAKSKGEQVMNSFKNQLMQSKARQRLNDTEINEIMDKLLSGEIQ